MEKMYLYSVSQPCRSCLPWSCHCLAEHLNCMKRSRGLLCCHLFNPSSLLWLLTSTRVPFPFPASMTGFACFNVPEAAGPDHGWVCVGLAQCPVCGMFCVCWTHAGCGGKPVKPVWVGSSVTLFHGCQQLVSRPALLQERAHLLG